MEDGVALRILFARLGFILEDLGYQSCIYRVDPRMLGGVYIFAMPRDRYDGAQ